MQRFYDVGEIILTDSHTMALRRFFILYSLFFVGVFFWFFMLLQHGVTTSINK